jgi:hypothetical protein
MQRAERMRKARMFRRLISEKRESELLDTAQALKFRRVNQSCEQLACRVAGFQPMIL